MKASNYSTHVQEVLAHVSALQGNVPMHRRESRRVYSFSALPFVQQLAIWDELWHNTNDFWVRLHASFFLERHMKTEVELLAMWPVIVNWQNRVDDWGLCDALAKIYTKILEVAEDEVYGQLKKWNADNDLWKRRQSLVSLLYYSRTKKKYLSFDKIEALIGSLLADNEYYVQKGVGWSLRELHNVYSQQTFSWLKQHIRSISSIAFTIAIEKMNPTMRDELKMLRKK